MIRFVVGRHTILIDNEDKDKLLRLRWTIQKHKNTNYAYSTTKPPERLHRYLLGLDPDDRREVDHINGNGLDNRKCNLRICTHQQNMQNQRRRTDNKSGHRGVHWVSRVNKWQARLMVGCRRVSVGYFDTKEDAAIAAETARYHIYGEFAGTGR